MKSGRSDKNGIANALVEFTRQDYWQHFKTISSATASRDLAFGVENKILSKTGERPTKEIAAVKTM